MKTFSITEAEVVRMESVMRDAIDCLKREREQKAVLVKLLLETQKQLEDLRGMMGAA